MKDIHNKEIKFGDTVKVLSQSNLVLEVIKFLAPNEWKYTSNSVSDVEYLDPYNNKSLGLYTHQENFVGCRLEVV